MDLPLSNHLTPATAESSHWTNPTIQSPPSQLAILYELSFMSMESRIVLKQIIPSPRIRSNVVTANYKDFREVAGIMKMTVGQVQQLTNENKYTRRKTLVWAA